MRTTLRGSGFPHSRQHGVSARWFASRTMAWRYDGTCLAWIASTDAVSATSAGGEGGAFYGQLSPSCREASAALALCLTAVIFGGHHVDHYYFSDIWVVGITMGFRSPWLAVAAPKKPLSTAGTTSCDVRPQRKCEEAHWMEISGQMLWVGGCRLAGRQYDVWMVGCAAGEGLEAGSKQFCACCPLQQSCNDPAMTCTLCPAGYEVNPGHVECSPRRGGYYCTEEESVAGCRLCYFAAGHNRPEGNMRSF